LVEWERVVGELRAAGYEVAGLSVDSARRSAGLRRRLGLSFPLLCDAGKQTLQNWELLNIREMGGIAEPAVVTLDACGQVLWVQREKAFQRLRPDEVVAQLRAGAAPPRPRAVRPGARAWGLGLMNAFRALWL